MVGVIPVKHKQLILVSPEYWGPLTSARQPAPFPLRLFDMDCILCTCAYTGAMLEYCAYNSDVYVVGESWLVDECTQCSCVQRAQVLCSVTVCEITSAELCPSSTDDAAMFTAACCPICHSQHFLLLTYCIITLYSFHSNVQSQICTYRMSQLSEANLHFWW